MNKTLYAFAALSVGLLASSASATDLFAVNFDNTDNTTIATCAPSGGAVYDFAGGACGGFDALIDTTSGSGTTAGPTDKAARVTSNTALTYCSAWGSYYGLSLNNGGAGNPNTTDPLDITSAVASGTIEFDIRSEAGDGEAAGNPGGAAVGAVPRGISVRFEDSSANTFEIYRFAIPAFTNTWTHVSLPIAPFISGTGAQAGFRAINPADFRKVVFVEGDFGGDDVATYSVDFLVDNVTIVAPGSAVGDWEMYQ